MSNVHATPAEEATFEPPPAAPRPAAPCAATYCSEACRAAALRGFTVPGPGAAALPFTLAEGHARFCGALRPPPAPLRLMSRGATRLAMMGCGWLPGDSPRGASGGGGGDVSVSGGWERPPAAFLARVDAALARVAPRRLLLVLATPWQPPFEDEAGPDSEPRYPVFQLSLPISGEGLTKAAVRAMRYIFAEEDRLCNTRYGSSGGMLGMLGGAVEEPPLYAKRSAGMRAALGMSGGLGGVAIIGPSTLRWGTPQGVRWLSGARAPFFAL